MSVPSHILAAAAAAVPSAENLEKLRVAALELANITARIENLSDDLKKAQEREAELKRTILPDLFAQAGTDKIGLPEAGVDINVKNYYKASISAEWPVEKQSEAFAWLESEGHGGLIRVTVSVSFGKGEIEKAKQLQELIRQSPIGNTHPAEIKMGVPWQTLTSFVREQYEAGEELPLETLGAVAGRIAEVKKRKEK